MSAQAVPAVPNTDTAELARITVVLDAREALALALDPQAQLAEPPHPARRSLQIGAVVVRRDMSAQLEPAARNTDTAEPTTHTAERAATTLLAYVTERLRNQEHKMMTIVMTKQ